MNLPLVPNAAAPPLPVPNVATMTDVDVSQNPSASLAARAPVWSVLANSRWLQVCCAALIIASIFVLPNSLVYLRAAGAVLGPSVLIAAMLWIVFKSDRKNFG
jgi:hypothetical protein